MEYNFSLDENKSSYHKKVVDFLRQEFPFFEIIQEFTIHMDNQTLFCDITCKSPIQFIIEINPRHHYEYTPYFHKTYANFKKAKDRDEIKARWAKMNDFEFIVLKEEDFKKDRFIE